MLGHTNIRTTQIYARITNEKVSNDMEILSEKLKNMGINQTVNQLTISLENVLDTYKTKKENCEFSFLINF